MTLSKRCFELTKSQISSFLEDEEQIWLLFYAVLYELKVLWNGVSGFFHCDFKLRQSHIGFLRAALRGVNTLLNGRENFI